MSEGNFITKIDNDEGYEVIFRQYTSDGDKTLFFGPASISLYDLLDKGFYLECKTRKNSEKQFPLKRCKLHLISPSGKDKYLLRKIFVIQLLLTNDLSGFIRDGVRVGQYYTQEDVFDYLHRLYPVKKKIDINKTFVGNRTLLEYVKDVLS